MFARYLRWWLQSPDGLLHETPPGGGEGGAGDGWPEYETPSGVGEGGEPPAGGGQPGAPAGGQPAGGQPGAEPGGAGRPAGGGQPAAAGQPGAGARSGELPPYRLEQIRERDALRAKIQELEDRDKTFKENMARALGIAGDRPAFDDRTLRLRQTLFTIMPELKDFVEKFYPKQAELLGLAESAPVWTDQQKNYWQGVAVRTQDALSSGVARLILGEGKTAADLDPELRDDVRDSFIAWVERDKTGQRVMRYEAQDRALVEDYLKGHFAAKYLDPVRRSAAVVIGARGQRVAALPQSGGSALPSAAAPPRVDNNDVEAVHTRAWAVLQSLRGATS